MGWFQGAGVVIGIGILFKLLGWIPLVLGAGAVGWVLFKLFGTKKSDEEEREG